MTSITKTLGQTIVTVNRRDNPGDGPNDGSIYITFSSEGRCGGTAAIEEGDLGAVLALVAKIKEI
jgi:hypothetical protein